jgi:N-acetylglutamate synthase-like GNAT family acetyltransferase
MEWTIELAHIEDREAILALAQSEPDALIEIPDEHLQRWIGTGCSFVARAVPGGEVVGHFAADYLPSINWVELRGAVVKPEYRQLGINSKLRERVMEVARTQYPSARMFSVTEAAAKSRGLVKRFGGSDIALDRLPDEVFALCPSHCYRRTGEPCGCRAFVYD